MTNARAASSRFFTQAAFSELSLPSTFVAVIRIVVVVL
jgi:hypothetical protein